MSGTDFDALRAETAVLRAQLASVQQAYRQLEEDHARLLVELAALVERLETARERLLGGDDHTMAQILSSETPPAGARRRPPAPDRSGLRSARARALPLARDRTGPVYDCDDLVTSGICRSWSGSSTRPGAERSAGIERSDRVASSVVVEEREGVVVVRPMGKLNDPISVEERKLNDPISVEEHRVIQDLAGRAVVVDLSQAVLGPREAVVALAGLLAGYANPGSFCFVTPRPSSRRLLQRWGICHCAAIFGSVGTLQARSFESEGFGDGWRPPPIPSTPDRWCQPGAGR